MKGVRFLGRPKNQEILLSGVMKVILQNKNVNLAKRGDIRDVLNIPQPKEMIIQFKQVQNRRCKRFLIVKIMVDIFRVLSIRF